MAEGGRLRILHLLNHCRFGHGNVHAAVDLACAQTAAGDEAIVASGDGELVPLLKANGVGHVLLDQERRGPMRVVTLVGRLCQLIWRSEPDVVHAHMMTGAVLGWAATRLVGVPLVATVHNAFERHATLMGLGDRVISVSQAVLEDMVGRGMRRSKLRVVLNGTLGAPRRDYFSGAEVALLHPNIVTICGLHDRKGVPDLLNAFHAVQREFGETHLYLVGDGPKRESYERLAEQLGLAQRAHFMGEIRDTKSILAQADIFSLASHADPAPLVVPEAREAGCAIVATNVDGIPELLDGGKAGALVPPKDPQALARSLAALLRDPQVLADAKVRAAQDLDFWSTGRVAEGTRSVYQELVSRRP